MATKVGNKYKTTVYTGTVNGKRQYKVFYADKASAADFEAELYKRGMKEKSDPARVTLGDAIDAYISSRDAALSPATIAAYKSIRKVRLQTLMGMQISQINNRILQTAINEESKIKTHKGETIKPKAVKNAGALAIAAITFYNEDARFKIVYPRQAPTESTTPNAEALQKIFIAVQGTNVELPVLLSSWLSLRASEICALKWSDVHDDYLSINSAMVYVGKTKTYKAPKTKAGIRNIPLPQYIRDKIIVYPKSDETYIFKLTRDDIYRYFSKALKNNGIPHCRFHDLRHANASVMALLGVPDRYAQERGGWSSSRVMKDVYQQTFSGEQKQFAERIDNYFEGILHTNLHT